MTTQKPREFWIEFWDSLPDNNVIRHRPVAIHPFTAIPDSKIYHVIEYSAYAELESKLQTAVEALDHISKPKHWNISTFVPEIRDRVLIAREAINKIKGDAE